MQIDSLASSIRRFSGDASGSLDAVGMTSADTATTESGLDSATTSVGTLVSGAANDLDSGNYEDAAAAIDSAIASVASARGRIGAFQRDTLDPAYRSSQTQIESLTASRSRIEDTDYAVETSNRTRATILTAASIKTLKIAQQQQASVLNLLGA
jgi:flagellin